MLKFRNERRMRLVEHSADGASSHQVEQDYTVPVPVLPRDWDLIAVRVAASLVLALTAVAVVWSTVSIGELLGGGVGYAAAVVFDVSWLVLLLVEWLARFDVDKRAFPRRVGWGLVAVAAGAIFWHGADAGQWALAVVGAAVSVVSKVLWLVVMRFVDKELSSADRQWVAAEVSKANAKLAIAGVRRQAAAAEARARLELLAAERTLRELDALSPSWAEPASDMSGADTEPEGELMEAAPAAVSVNSTNTVRTPIEAAPSIAELARQQLLAGAEPKSAVSEILRLVPSANPESVAATVRRENRRIRRPYL
ncbi:hypothetical protein [Streptomyces sp. CC210A]|uniref:hypothetical protein n=1 Tax=Streptomyces sp. CC210A TaxID=2898184 RepID=UPI001F2EDC96|nr:hypothetical protein [Streptomyces sp. CC210A]